MQAGARPHVDDVVGAVDRFLVVLDDDDGVSGVAQAYQGVDQAAVVALVQPDRGLVEDVHHPDEPCPDLAREPDPLRLPAGEGLGGAVEREVVEPHVDEELQPLRDLPEDPARDLRLRPAEIEIPEEIPRRADRQRGEGGEGLAGDEDVARGPVEPGAAAGVAGAGAEVLRELVADHARFRLPVPALHVGDHALEGVLADVAPAPLVAEGEADDLGAAAVEDGLAHRRGQLAEGDVEVEAVVRGERLDDLEVVGVAPIPAADRAAGQAQLRMGDDPGRIEEGAHPEPVTLPARPGGVVEREDPRLELRDRVAADVAGEAGREHRVAALAVHRGDHGAAVGEGERGLERFGEAKRQIVADPEAIDHHFDRMPALRIERDRLVELAQHAVDPGPHEALRPQALDDLRVLALAVVDDRGEQHEALAALAALARHDRIDHLAHGLRVEHDPVVRAARLAGTREEEPQVVVDLGDGPDRGARVVRGRFLLDGDRGRQPLDVLDVRLFHHREELARVGGEGLDVAPLPLGVDGVERERGLARSREPGDHHQPVAGNVDVDGFEVVRPGATDADGVHRRITRLDGGRGNRLSYAPRRP